MRTLKSRLTDLEKKFTELLDLLKKKKIIEDTKKPENKSNLVDAVVKPQVADESTMNKLQLFLAKNESITKGVADLNKLLTYKCGDKECKVQFHETTGIPYVKITEGISFSYYHWVKLELDDLRQVIKWLKDVGIE
jgi:hypothetical protein